MNIILINHYAGSLKYGMEYRPYYMAREWVRAGHEVSIVAASHSHLRSKQPPAKGEVSEEYIEGVRYVWLKTPSYSGNGIGRVINMITFIYRLFLNRKRIVGGFKPDAIIASSTYPLDIFPAHYFAFQNNARLIFEVHDLWPLSPMELGKMSRWHPFIMVMQWAENYAYRNADKVISMLPKAFTYMQEHGMKERKFIYIPNGISIDEWYLPDGTLPAEHERTFGKLRKDKKFILVYAGAHGIANALETLVEAMEKIDDPQIVAVLVGQGSEKERLQQIVSDKNLDSVIFLPAVAKSLIPCILNQANVLYIGWKHQPLYRFGINPNKLFDYLMSEKAVIHSVKAGNNLVDESGCGLSVPPENPQAVAEAIIKLQALSTAERNLMGKRGREYVMKYHDYRILARKFIESL